MRKEILIFSIFLSVVISTVFAIPTAWENITDRFERGDFWTTGDSIDSEVFNSLVEQVISNQNFDNFLSMFGVVVDKVMQIEKKFANIFSDDSGNVGIGTTNPRARLEIRDNKATYIDIVDTTVNGNGHKFIGSEGTHFVIKQRNATDTTDEELFRINSDGYIDAPRPIGGQGGSQMLATAVCASRFPGGGWTAAYKRGNYSTCTQRCANTGSVYYKNCTATISSRGYYENGGASSNWGCDMNSYAGYDEFYCCCSY